MTETVLVTGGSGFVATHLVSQLLDRGYTVRASVRSLASAAKVEPLRRLGAGRAGRLELFEADLLRPGSFDAAIDGCRYVFPVASPRTTPTTTPRRWPSKPPGSWPGHRTAGRW
jgi:nucleoside-diphosphate-sugar epimerase